MSNLPPMPDLPNAQRWTTALVLEYACSYAEEAVRLEREAYRELWTAAARVALSNGFDAAYPANLAALKSMIQSTRGRARSQEGQG